jgi:hypothetical protein
MNMKKYFYVLILIIVSALPLSAFALSENTDLAAGKTAYGTFSNPLLATDGKIKGPGAASGDLNDSPQYLNIDLGANMYLDRIKVYWSSDAYSNDFMIKTSSDAKTWQDEAAGLDAAKGVEDAASGTIATSISLTRAMINSRYVQIIIPAGSKVTNLRGNFVRINEVQVFPSVNQTFSLVSTESYSITDTTCAVRFKTSIGAASGVVSFGTDPNKLDRVASNCESGIENSYMLSGLKPKTNYFFQIKATDFYGSSIASRVLSFVTLTENVALKKKVTGTFTALPPNEKYIQAGSPDEILARVTDGGTSFFTSMATSGPISGGDQYVIIDLERSYNIKTILSYWRRLAYSESFSVQVSDDAATWKTVGDSLNANNGTFARSDAGDPMKILKTPGASGRYVKILVKQGSPFFHKHSDWDFVQLMEVQVFAD